MWKNMAFSALVAIIPFFSTVHTEESRYQKYLNFLKEHECTDQYTGSYKKGEIEIVKDLKVIKEIEDFRKALLLKRGYTKAHAEESSRIGILVEDEYWMWVRDGVIFPTGAKGTYNRIVLKREMSDPVPRVAMLPILPDGKIVLNLNYRHALRKWVLEIPRGFKLRDEPDIDAVKRQLRRETGYEMLACDKLGELSPDSGCLSTRVPVYLVHLGEKKLSSQAFSEAILRNEVFTLEKVKEALASGGMTLDINGVKERVEVCDSYLAYSILLAESHKILAKAQ